jgi:endonuclease YncB( thermonuclease family)
VLAEIGEVVGPMPQRTRAGMRVFDPVQDWLLTNPMQRRRNFMSRWINKQETTRLRGLFESQGKQVIPNSELQQLAPLLGLGHVALNPEWLPQLEKMLLDQGIVLQSYIERLAEARAVEEIQHTMYNFEMASQAGRQAKWVAPFGQAYGDMMAFWGREMFRPIPMRPYLTRSRIGQKISAASNRLPLNPKAFSTLSRYANTDMSFELPFTDGQTEVDLSRLLFLPTKGENAFASILPGIGLIPLSLIDFWISQQADAETDPLDYVNVRDKFAQFLPYVEYQRGGAHTRAIGGGTIGKLIAVGSDALAHFSGDPYLNTSFITGDTERQQLFSRNVQVALSDPAVWERLDEFTTEAEFYAFMDELTQEASGQASGMDILGKGISWALPVSLRQLGPTQEVQNMWIDAARQLPELAVPELENLPLDSADRLSAVADAVRRKYFRLEDWERDLLIAQYRPLVTAEIGMWQWTQDAIDAGIAGTEGPYRTGNTRADQARHDLYFQRNLITTAQFIPRFMRMVGASATARDRSAIKVWSEMSTARNDFAWDNVVSEETKQAMQWLLDQGFGARVGISDTKSMWLAFGSLEDSIEGWMALNEGVRRGTEEFDLIKSRVKLPEKDKAWGTDWPGTDIERIPHAAEWANYVLGDLNDLSPTAAKIVKGLGIEIGPEDTGFDLIRALQNEVSNPGSAIYGLAQQEHANYVRGRGEAGSTILQTLARVANLDSVAPAVREQIGQFIEYEKNMSAQYRATSSDGVPASAQARVRQKYAELMLANPTLMPWQSDWDRLYEPRYGPLNWIPPTPPPLIKGVAWGGDASETWQPYVRTVVDGDTILVSEGPNTTPRKVRILGLRAPDYGYSPEESAAAEAATVRLIDRLEEAAKKGEEIWLVREPEKFGETDYYGRELAWLFIGDEAYWDPVEGFKATDSD